MEAEGDYEELPTAHLSLTNIKSLTTLLQAIKVSAKQTCSIALGPEGVGIHWEDESKTLRSSVQLRSELFSSYECGPAKRVFGVNFAQLVDTLSVFASAAAAAALNLHYPGPDGELQLEMCDAGDAIDGSAQQCVLYARIATLEQDIPPDMTDYWAEPAASFIIAGGLLKEAVDDLEWPGGSVSIKLVRDPPAISMAAAGTGSLEVQFNSSDLTVFQVPVPDVVQRYKYKNLKVAMSHIPDSKDMGGSISTKVSIDANGLLKVTHMVPLQGSGLGQAASMQPSALSGFAGTQAALESSRTGVIQFVSLPVEEED